MDTGGPMRDKPKSEQMKIFISSADKTKFRDKAEDIETMINKWLSENGNLVSIIVRGNLVVGEHSYEPFYIVIWYRARE